MVSKQHTIRAADTQKKGRKNVFCAGSSHTKLLSSSAIIDGAHLESIIVQSILYLYLIRQARLERKLPMKAGFG